MAWTRMRTALVLGAWVLTIPGLAAQQYTYDVWSRVYRGSVIHSMAMGDVNGDGLADLVIGMAASGEGRVEVFYGRSTPFSSTPDVTLRGEALNDYFGLSVAVGDVDGDGFDDVVVGAPYYDNAFLTDAGAVYVFRGGNPMDSVYDLRIVGEQWGSRFGYRVAVGPGLDANVFSDTQEDIVVGAPYYDTATETDAGAVYVFFGSNPLDGAYDLKIEGSSASDLFGFSVDLIRYGTRTYASVVVGAPYRDVAGTDAGAVYVYHGGNPMDALPDIGIYGETAGERAGWSVANVGDLNRDGSPEFAVGAPYRTFAGDVNVGAVYLFTGYFPRSSYEKRIVGTQEGERLGVAMAPAGDVNGDGYGDFMIASGNYRSPATGAVRVFFGDSTFNTLPRVALVGTVYSPLTGGKDLNGDGKDDFVVRKYASGFQVVHNVYLYRLLSPVGGETWNVGASHTIAWLGVEPADVYLSVDGGHTWQKLADNIPGRPYPETTRFTFRVPHTPTRYALVKIADGSTGGLNPAYTVVSDSFFRIDATVILLAFEKRETPEGVRLSWQTRPGPEDLEGYLVDKELGDGSRIRLTPTPVQDTVLVDTDRRPGTYVLLAVNGWGRTYEVGRLDSPPGPLGMQVFPNRETRVYFYVPSRYDGGPTPVRLLLFDRTGRRVQLLWEGLRPEGFHTVRTSLRGLPRGVYILRMEAGSVAHSVKVSLVR